MGHRDVLVANQLKEAAPSADGDRENESHGKDVQAGSGPDRGDDC
jgi:hypothetical protein